jgi:hypothetical protein
MKAHEKTELENQFTGFVKKIGKARAALGPVCYCGFTSRDRDR